jgi:A/G-specific adenine glycosylase
MLQQTRAETVLDRYSSFLLRFPTIQSLADTPLQAVLSEWQGLGYYSRARNLHRSAQILVNHYQGKLPDNRKNLMKLPGFGPYMSGAVASIAFNKREAAVDGNAVRVLTRLLDIDSPADSPSGKKILEEEAEALVSPSRPGDFNQAMMDLGAGICVPQKPQCHTCPINKECQSLSTGTVSLRPVKSKKNPPKNVTIFQLWAMHRNRLRLVRRKENGLFGGMWELPGYMTEGHQDDPDRKKLQQLCQSALGPGWKAGEEITRISRTLTHRRILFVVLVANLQNRAFRSSSKDFEIWAKDEDLGGLPISTAQRAAVKAAQAAIGIGQKNLFEKKIKSTKS